MNGVIREADKSLCRFLQNTDPQKLVDVPKDGFDVTPHPAGYLPEGQGACPG